MDKQTLYVGILTVFFKAFILYLTWHQRPNRCHACAGTTKYSVLKHSADDNDDGGPSH